MIGEWTSLSRCDIDGEETHPPAEYLVDGRALLQRTLRNHLRPHLLHVQHEGVQGLLDVRLFLVWRQQQQQKLNSDQDDGFGADRRIFYLVSSVSFGLKQILLRCLSLLR